MWRGINWEIGGHLWEESCLLERSPELSGCHLEGSSPSDQNLVLYYCCYCLHFATVELVVGSVE